MINSPERVCKIAEMWKTIWVRTPIIPGYTDSEKNISCIARFIRQNLSNTTRYDLIAFNVVCVHRYNRLGIPLELDGVNLVTRDTMACLAKVAQGEGLEFVHWSVMTRADKEIP
jgi:pyruvate formate lyase activating enzyme